MALVQNTADNTIKTFTPVREIFKFNEEIQYFKDAEAFTTQRKVKKVGNGQASKSRKSLI